jgi:hypothetical protein
VIVCCTSKALALLKVSARALANPPASDDDWYMNLLWLDRGKCLLLAHAGTLFPVFVADVRAADLRPLGRYVVRIIEGELASEGLQPDSLGQLDPDAVQVAKTASRSVLGFMNEMALFLEYAVADAGRLGRCDSNALNRHLRRRLHSRDGYATPLELVARRLSRTASAPASTGSSAADTRPRLVGRGDRGRLD